MSQGGVADSSSSIVVRAARLDDLEAIVTFNAAMALETEGKKLDLNVLTTGVRRGLKDPERLRYWVAECSTPTRVIGQAAISREWSDWRNGWLWWLESVYVLPEYRGRGVFRSLHRQIRAEAKNDPEVIGLRLYVEQDNQPAQRTYQALGFRSGGYLVFEELWSDRFSRSPG